MNPDLPSNEREELEARITALLLGEMPPEEAAELRDRITREPELASLHAKLRHSIDLVESASHRTADAMSAIEPLRLSDNRRKELLKVFRKRPEPLAIRFSLSNYFVPIAAAAIIMLVAAFLLLPARTRGKAGVAMLAQRSAGTMTVTAGEREENLRRAPGVPAGPDSSEALATSEATDGTVHFGAAAAQASRPNQVITTRKGTGIAGVEFLEKAQQSAGVASSGAATADSSQSALGGPFEVRQDEAARVRLRDAEATTLDADHLGGLTLTAPANGVVRRSTSLPAAPPSSAGGAVLQRRELERVPGLKRPAMLSGGLGGGAAGPGLAPEQQSSSERFARARNRAADAPSRRSEILSAGVQPASPSTGPAEEPNRSYGRFRQQIESTTSPTPTLGDVPLAGRFFSKDATDKSAGNYRGGNQVFYDLTPDSLPEQLAKKVETPESRLSEVPPAIKQKAAQNPDATVLDRGEIALGYELKEQESAARSLKTPPADQPALAEAKLTNSIDLFQNAPLPAKPRPPLEHQPEVAAADDPFSTFSLNVSDVSFKLANVALENGALPDPDSIRAEEFINAFDYQDPAPAPGSPIAFTWERARHPFAHNRDLLRLSVKTAAVGRPEGQALNLTLLLDNSGSMERADRVRIIQEALRVLGAQMQAQDRLSVVTFARQASLKADGVTGSDAAKVLESVAALTPEGGTNLEEAMNVAYAAALRNYLPAGQNRVVLLTDGAANLGDVTPENLKKKVEDHRKQGIALDCFGIGWEGYNDDLLETLSRNGDGRYGFVNTPEAAASDFAAQLAGALQVAASDVKVQVEFNPARVVAYRQLGYAKHQLTKEQFRDNTVDAAEIAAAEAGNALYVVQVKPDGAGDLGTLRVRYKVPGTAFHHEHEWAVPYLGPAAPLEKASPALRLNATAGLFADWLARNPYAAEANPGVLLGLLQGVPEVYGADTRPKMLENMIQQARRIAGN